MIAGQFHGLDCLSVSIPGLIIMNNYTHQTAPTQFVEAAGLRFAYRRVANHRSGVTIDVPLLFFMHFTGTMDHWDPDLPVNWIAADIVRMENGILVEHWDVIQDEVTSQESKSGLPMFGEAFTK
jgi:hypothetical protein